MNCNEFTKKVESLTLAELSHSADQQWLAHRRDCAACSNWLQQKQQLTGAMLTLRNSTAMLEAPIHVEQQVLHAFRRSAQTAPLEREVHPLPFAFRLSRFFEWGAYAAAAAALAISLGLGFWLWQHSSQTAAQSAQEPKTTTEQIVRPEVVQPNPVAQLSKTDTERPIATAMKSGSEKVFPSSAATTQAASGQSLAQAAQAQGYTPLMLCDPISCSGDEQVVRMELPASADGSTGTQMADVVVGDDGLVRAIRIVQQ